MCKHGFIFLADWIETFIFFLNIFLIQRRPGAAQDPQMEGVEDMPGSEKMTVLYMFTLHTLSCHHGHRPGAAQDPKRGVQDMPGSVLQFYFSFLLRTNPCTDPRSHRAPSKGSSAGPGLSKKFLFTIIYILFKLHARIYCFNIAVRGFRRLTLTQPTLRSVLVRVTGRH